LARAAKERGKAAKATKEEQRIVTPKRTSRSRNQPQSRRRPQRDGEQKDSPRRSWEVGDDGDGVALRESVTAS